MKYLLTGQETKRLHFRLVDRSYFSEWMALFTESDAARFLGMGHIATAEEQCEQWFARLEGRYAKDLGGMNAIIDKHTNKLVGQAGLLVQVVDGTTELEVAYSFLPAYWNHGYATEAAQKCRDVAFENEYADSLISIIHVDNVRSQRVAIKNGMNVSKQTVFKDMPVDIFRITHREWLKLQE